MDFMDSIACRGISAGIVVARPAPIVDDEPIDLFQAGTPPDAETGPPRRLEHPCFEPISLDAPEGTPSSVSPSRFEPLQLRRPERQTEDLAALEAASLQAAPRDPFQNLISRLDDPAKADQYLSEIATDPRAATAFLKAETLAMQTADGKLQVEGLVEAVERHPETEALLLQVENRAASTSEGRSTLAAMYRVEAQDPRLVANQARLDAAAMATPEGCAEYATLERQAALSPTLSAGMVQYEAAALRDPEARPAMQQVLEQAARDPEVASARVANEAAAAQTPQGRVQLAALQHEVAQDPHVAALWMQGQAQAVETPEGLAAVTWLARNEAQDPSTASSFVEVENAALKTPAGRDAMVAVMASVQQDEPAAASLLQVHARAAETPRGRQEVASVLTAASHDPELASQYARVEATAQAIPEGRRARESMLRVAAQDPPLAVAEVRLEVAQQATAKPESVSQPAAVKPESVSQAAAVKPESVSQPAIEESRPAPQQVPVERDIAAVRAGKEGRSLVDARIAAVARVPERAVQEVIGMAAAPRLHEALTQKAQAPHSSAQFIRLLESAATTPQGRPAVHDILKRGGGPLVQVLAAASFGNAAQRRTVASLVQKVAAEPELLPAMHQALQATDPSRVPTGFIESVRTLLQQKVPGTFSAPSKMVPGTFSSEKERQRAEVVPVPGVPRAPEARHLEPVPPISLFDLDDKKARVCVRCGDPYQSRVPCCPACQREHRDVILQNTVSFTRAGQIFCTITDRVETTAEARQAMADGASVAALRRPPAFIQLRDLLELHCRPYLGFATV